MVAGQGVRAQGHRPRTGGAADAWEPLIEEHLNGLKQRDRVRICDVAKFALGFDNPSRLGTQEQRRIAAVMLALGWRRGRRVGKGRFWEPPDAPGW
jgi:hypothetical protein